MLRIVLHSGKFKQPQKGFPPAFGFRDTIFIPQDGQVGVV